MRDSSSTTQPDAGVSNTAHQPTTAREEDKNQHEKETTRRTQQQMGTGPHSGKGDNIKPPNNTRRKHNSSPARVEETKMDETDTPLPQREEPPKLETIPVSPKRPKKMRYDTSSATMPERTRGMTRRANNKNGKD
jgi:hypothetical protein